MTDGEIATRRQALVTVDKIEEALRDGSYQAAADATRQLATHVGELQEVGDGD